MLNNGFPATGGQWAYRLTGTQRAILGALADTAPRTTADIAAHLEKEPRAVRPSLRWLLDQKLIASAGETWSITNVGTQALTILAAAGEETSG